VTAALPIFAGVTYTAVASKCGGARSIATPQAAIAELEGLGVTGIAGDCGFLVNYQREATRMSTKVPCFISAMLQAPRVSEPCQSSFGAGSGQHTSPGVVDTRAESRSLAVSRRLSLRGEKRAAL